MDYDLELKKAIDIIKKNKSRLVCIQLPDGLKPESAMIKREIKDKTDAEVLIWAGSCFGACDVPLELENMGVDLVIQWGHSEFC